MRMILFLFCFFFILTEYTYGKYLDKGSLSIFEFKIYNRKNNDSVIIVENMISWQSYNTFTNNS